MTITLYRYDIIPPTWNNNNISLTLLNNVANVISEFPFAGRHEPEKFGFIKCAVLKEKLYGLFIQKHPSSIINYDDDTKEPKNGEVIESGEYFFIIDFSSYCFYLQAKRSSELPGKKEITNKFHNLFNAAVSSLGISFNYFKEADDIVDREKIKNIFYNEADRVTEIELEDFTTGIIIDEKEQRGGSRQTYFNPIEEYQEAMEEGAVKFSQNAAKAMVKAKKGGSIQKDPITRAMLESANKPTKITYIKENRKIVAKGVIESKVIVSVESDHIDFTDEKQIQSIFNSIYGGEYEIEDDDNNQIDEADNTNELPF
jgi:hypothetical protein